MALAGRRGRRGIALVAGALCLAARLAPGQTFDLKGQASAWLAMNDSRPANLRFGLRYIPDLSLSLSPGRDLTLDAEVAVNAYLNGEAPDGRFSVASRDMKLYRGWVRFATPRFEARAGLQKISFGSASVLRPLMWFDRLDPRDPLQVTDGVTGLLVRYYFPGNANIWAWGLTGNDEAKGWETSPTVRRSAEFGGRVQVPVFTGELAFTYHHRRADLGRGILAGLAAGDVTAPEDRFALDGKWDLGVGVWFEGALIRERTSALASPDQRQINLGADYVFGVGNGLRVQAEHLIVRLAPGPWRRGSGTEFSAAVLSYPAGLFDNLSGVFFYDWTNRDAYAFLSWQRTTDRWQLYLIGFWNPDQGRIYPSASGGAVFGGKGIRLMAVFNH
jgi:hypothetical protein